MQVEMSVYLKNDVKVTSMVSNGNEGYRVRGQYGVPHSRSLLSMMYLDVSTLPRCCGFVTGDLN